MAPKRKRGKAPGTSDTVTKVNKASIPISVQAPLSSNSEGAGSAETTTVTPAVLTACRSAVVRSPATSRAALDKHRESIDPDLATVLEIVGGYAIEVFIPRLNPSLCLPPIEYILKPLVLV
jgi:hypothetical protein